MRKIVFILCAALMAVCCQMPARAASAEAVKTTKTAKKKPAARKKATARVLATFEVEGNSYQLLSGGKIKCLTNPDMIGSYKKETDHVGFSAYSPVADWYIISLGYKNGDGENYYLIFDDFDLSDKILELTGGSIDFDIDVNPINYQVTITPADAPDASETKDFDQLTVAGTVKWTKR